MRLIDAEVVKEFFRENLILPDKSHEKIVETMIDAIPTAYDIDKVVEEFEKVKTINVDVGYGTIYKTIRKDVAIEIVKQGSVSDDVCEWKKSKDYPFDWLVGCDGCEVTHRQGDYCPRCGKKIKVVE